MNFRTLIDTINLQENCKIKDTNVEYKYVRPDGISHMVSRRNQYFYNRVKYLKSKGFKDVSLYEHYDLFTRETLSEAQRCENRCVIYIHTNISDYRQAVSYTLDFKDKQIRETINYKGNLEITSENIKKICFDHIEKKHLFVPGGYRTYQENTLYSKDMIKKILINGMGRSKELIEISNSNCMALLEHRIYSKFNFECNIYDVRKAYVVAFNYVKKNGIPSEPMQINSINSLIQNLTSSDLDFDELESEFFNAMASDTLYV